MRVFLFSLAMLSLVLAVQLMVQFFLVPAKLLGREYLSSLRMVYLFTVTAYGGGSVAEARIYEGDPTKRHWPFEFLTIAWGVIFAIFTGRVILNPEAIGIGLYGELSFVVAWVFGVFIATRAGKDFPDTWLRN
jgi:hypothetical protein